MTILVKQLKDYFTTNFAIKTGLSDFFVPFQASILPTSTTIEPKQQGAYWDYQASFDIIVQAKNLSRDNVDLQLGNIEREIMRLACMYNGQIAGVEAIYYRGQERIYGIDDNYAKSNWATRIVITVRYHVTA